MYTFGMSMCFIRETTQPINSVQFVDNCVEKRHVTVDSLVGVDAYWRFIILNNGLQTGGSVAQE